MSKAMLRFTSKIAVFLLVIFGLIELGLAMWTVLESRYKTLAYNLADVGYIDLWILRYISMCLFASSIITLVMCLILIWGLCSAHVFIFIASIMLTIVFIAELIIAIVTFSSKFQTRLTLQEQLPKLVITYRQGNDERASRALDSLQLTFRCCGSDGRLSYQNNVPLTCHMYSIGCLPRTMFFLDSCLDALAAVLLFFSLVKLLIVIFFYAFLCIYRRHRRKHRHHTNTDPINNNPSRWHHSSSFDSESSSSDNLPKKLLISPPIIHHDNDYIEKRQVILNEYDSQTLNKRVQSAPMLLPPESNNTNQNLSTPPNEPKTTRKLSSISEKTEKTETDESEPDLLRCRHYNSKRQVIITPVNTKQVPPPLPKKLPTIKNRKKNPGGGIGEDDNDSGVERSSSEKSFEEPNSIKRHSAASSSMETLTKSKTSINSKPTPTLSFSNVFVTSVSQGETANHIRDDDRKKSLTNSPSSSSSFSDHLLHSDVATPKPILKKSPQQSSPSSDQDRIPPSYQEQKKISSILNTKTFIKVPQASTTNNSTKIYVPYKTKENLPLNNTPKPAPAPRPSLKQSSFDKQDESLV